MKTYFTGLIGLLISVCSLAQSSEFQIHKNGLIYNETTMGQLSLIVDSLNLTYRQCDPPHTYVGIGQTMGHYVHLDTGDISAAKIAMEAGISFEDFVVQFPLARVQRDLRVVQWTRETEEGLNLTYESIGLGEEQEKSLRFESEKVASQSPWQFHYWEEGEYSEESLRAFYLTEPIEHPELPSSYARMVQYVDCLVDTSGAIFHPEATYESWRFQEETQKGKAMKELEALVFTKKDSYYPTEKQLNKAARSPKFTALLDAAIEEAIASNYSTSWLEQLAEEHHSPAAALELKRRRRVIGGCSMDQAPRIHAMQIARLSAESINWGVFLRAHLNIMNDRFERVSDGSYAWAERQTYIRELEELEINVPDLLLGSCLRLENSSPNHYFGSIGRVGRALAETQQPDEVEAQMKAMIADPELDDLNRYLIYWVYLNYLHHLPEGDHKSQQEHELPMLAQQFPMYMQGGEK